MKFYYSSARLLLFLSEVLLLDVYKVLPHCVLHPQSTRTLPRGNLRYSCELGCSEFYGLAIGKNVTCIFFNPNQPLTTLAPKFITLTILYHLTQTFYNPVVLYPPLTCTCTLPTPKHPNIISLTFISHNIIIP